MKYIFLLLLIIGSSARFVRYHPLKCIAIDDYKLCEVSLNGDYMVNDLSIYVEHNNQIFMKGGTRACIHTDGQLIVPSTEWNNTRWEFILNKYTGAR